MNNSDNFKLKHCALNYNRLQDLSILVWAPKLRPFIYGTYVQSLVKTVFASNINQYAKLLLVGWIRITILATYWGKQVLRFLCKKHYKSQLKNI